MNNIGVGTCWCIQHHCNFPCSEHCPFVPGHVGSVWWCLDFSINLWLKLENVRWGFLWNWHKLRHRAATNDHLNVFSLRCIALSLRAAAQCPKSNGAFLFPLSPFFSNIYILPSKSRVVACMTAILSQMDDRHYATYIETFSGTYDLVVSTDTSADISELS